VRFILTRLRTTKNALHPPFKGRTKSVLRGFRGTTFICSCFAARASSSTYILQPGYGGYRQRSTLAQSDFFSQLRVFFHSVSTYGLSTSRPLSACNKQPLLVPSKLFPYSIVLFVHPLKDQTIRAKFILARPGQLICTVTK
jgi:hypothetical protein